MGNDEKYKQPLPLRQEPGWRPLQRSVTVPRKMESLSRSPQLRSRLSPRRSKAKPARTTVRPASRSRIPVRSPEPKIKRASSPAKSARRPQVKAAPKRSISLPQVKPLQRKAAKLSSHSSEIVGEKPAIKTANTHGAALSKSPAPAVVSRNDIRPQKPAKTLSTIQTSALSPDPLYSSLIKILTSGEKARPGAPSEDAARETAKEEDELDVDNLDTIPLIEDDDLIGDWPAPSKESLPEKDDTYEKKPYDDTRSPTPKDLPMKSKPITKGKTKEHERSTQRRKSSRVKNGSHDSPFTSRRTESRSSISGARKDTNPSQDYTSLTRSQKGAQTGVEEETSQGQQQKSGMEDEDDDEDKNEDGFFDEIGAEDGVATRELTDDEHDRKPDSQQDDADDQNIYKELGSPEDREKKRDLQKSKIDEDDHEDAEDEDETKQEKEPSEAEDDNEGDMTTESWIPPEKHAKHERTLQEDEQDDDDDQSERMESKATRQSKEEEEDTKLSGKRYTEQDGPNSVGSEALKDEEGKGNDEADDKDEETTEPARHRAKAHEKEENKEDEGDEHKAGLLDHQKDREGNGEDEGEGEAGAKQEARKRGPSIDAEDEEDDTKDTVTEVKENKKDGDEDQEDESDPPKQVAHGKEEKKKEKKDDEDEKDDKDDKDKDDESPHKPIKKTTDTKKANSKSRKEFPSKSKKGPHEFTHRKHHLSAKSKLPLWHIHQLKGQGRGMGSGKRREFALKLREKALRRKTLRQSRKHTEISGSDIINSHFSKTVAPSADLGIKKEIQSAPKKDVNAPASATWAKASDNGVGGNTGLARLLGIVFGCTIGFIVIFLVIYWLCVRSCRRKRARREQQMGEYHDDHHHTEKSPAYHHDISLDKHGSTGSGSSGSVTLNDEDDRVSSSPPQPELTEKPKSFQNVKQKLKLRDFQPLRRNRHQEKKTSTNFQAGPKKIPSQTPGEKTGSWEDDFSLAAYRPFSALTTPTHFRSRSSSANSGSSTASKPRSRSLRPMYLARLGSGDPVGRPPNIAEIPETITEDREREREARADSKTQDWVAEQSQIWKRRFSRRLPNGVQRQASFGRRDEPSLTFLPSARGAKPAGRAAQSRFPIAVASPKKAEERVGDWTVASPVKTGLSGEFQPLPPLDFSTHPGTKIDLDQGRVRIPSDVLDACLERRRAMRRAEI